jgi:C2H2-type zinc finger protein
MQEKNTEDSKTLECKICHLKFINKNYFESHMKIEHEEHLPPSGVT